MDAGSVCSVPPGPGPFPLLVYVHGGFFKTQWSRTNTATHHVTNIFQQDHAILDLEYSRVNQTDPHSSSGGWPHTCFDLIIQINHVIRQAEFEKVDLQRVFVVGHSAGGTLALWIGIFSRMTLEQRRRIFQDDSLGADTNMTQTFVAGIHKRIRVVGVAAIAPVANLRVAAARGYSDFHDAIPNYFWRCGPSDQSLDSACPYHLLTQLTASCSVSDTQSEGLRVLLIHGLCDVDVPPIESLRFAKLASSSVLIQPVYLHLQSDADHLEVVGILNVTKRAGGPERWQDVCMLLRKFISEGHSELQLATSAYIADGLGKCTFAPQAVSVSETRRRIESGEEIPCSEETRGCLVRGLERWQDWCRVSGCVSQNEEEFVWVSEWLETDLIGQ